MKSKIINRVRERQEAAYQRWALARDAEYNTREIERMPQQREVGFRWLVPAAIVAVLFVAALAISGQK